VGKNYFWQKLNKIKLKQTLKKYCLLAFAFVAWSTANSQDIHFTQFYASPLTLNPALTGYFDGAWRVSAIYRNQWKAIGGHPYSTAGLGFDMPFFCNGEQFNGGVVVVSDRSGVVGLISNRVYLNLSYLRHIEKNTVAFGIQPGFVLESTDINEYTFNEQFDLGNPDVFNNSISNNETGLNKSFNFFDLNAGVLWTNQLTKKFKPEAGLTVMHLTRPTRSFSNTKNDTTRFAIRYVFHGGGTLKMGTKMRLKPNLLYMYQKKATEMLIGSNLEYDLPSKSFKTVYGGTLLRYGWNNNLDASSWIVGLIWKNINVGFSYDINVSSLKAATNNRGAWEISLIYISPSTKPDKIRIPCDRY